MANLLEVLSGARLSNEIGHRLEQWGIPSSWASNIGTAISPTVLPHHFTSYYAARERGMDPTDARQFATSDALRTAAAAGATYGAVSYLPGAMGYTDWGSVGNTALDHVAPRVFGGSGSNLTFTGGDIPVQGLSEADAQWADATGNPNPDASFGTFMNKFGKSLQQNNPYRVAQPSDAGLNALVQALLLRGSAQQSQQGIPVFSTIEST